MKSVICFVIVLSLASVGTIAGAYDLTWDFNQEYELDNYTKALWHFNESSGDTIAYDESYLDNDAGIDSGLDPDDSWAAAKFGNGLNSWYTSSADYNLGTMAVPQDTPGTGSYMLFVDGSFTVEFWMKARATSGGSWSDYVLSKGTGSVFAVIYDQNNLSFLWYGGGGWNNYTDTTNIPLNEWHHVAICVDTNKDSQISTISFYIDGDLSSDTTGAWVTDNPAFGYDLYMMGAQSGHPNNCFQGQLEELRISNVNRMNPPETPAEYERLTADEFTVGLWHFDEMQGAGDTAYDETGYDNDAVIDTNATMYGYGPLQSASTWAPAVDGNGLNSWLNSTGDNNVGTLVVEQTTSGGKNASLLIDGDYTIEFWMNAKASSQGSWTDSILCKGSGYPYQVKYDYNRIQIVWNSGVWNTYYDSTFIPLNQWHHVNINIENNIGPSFNQAFVSVFIDGVLSSSDTVNNFTDNGAAAYELNIMGPRGGHPFNCFYGQLDELRISKVDRLNPPDTTTPPVLPPSILEPFEEDEFTMGLWHFDETTGSTICYDSSLNHNDGVIDTGATMYGYGPLDPDKVWEPAMFDNGISSWTNGTADQNVGTFVVEQDTPGGANSTLFMEDDITIEFWMNARATSSGSWQHYILAKGTGSVYNIRYDYNRLQIGWYGGGGWQNYYDSTFIPLYQWHHVAILIDNTLLDTQSIVWVFVDGQLSTSDTVAKFADDPAHGYDLTIMGAPGGHPYNGFKGQLDELRISNCLRSYGDIVGAGPLKINWLKPVGNDVEMEFNSLLNRLYVMRESTDSPGSGWEKLAGMTAGTENGKYRTRYTHTNGLLGAAKRFYRVEDFVPESMGYAQIQSKSPSVDSFLTEWTDTDMIATRDNFFEFPGRTYMPYVQSDVYGSFNATDQAFYFAWEVKEQSSSDVLELMFSDPSDTTITDQIRFDKAGQFMFYVFEGSSIHPRWDTGVGDTYTYSDLIAEGGSFADVTIGGTWKVEIKVPYSFIGPSFGFTGGDSVTAHFNWETGAGTKLGTTNPKKTFWPITGSPIEYDEPGVGVSRP